ncbi:MAG: hypothetical protein WCG08_04230 [Paludibacter sp.]
MINKKVLLFICGCIFIGFLPKELKAQNIAEIKADRENFIWGEGSGATLKEADQIALADIIGQISTQVESRFEKTVSETGDKFKETVNDVLKTYSSATLKNTERVIVQNEPDTKVFRYVRRTEVAKVFESRKNKLIELAHNGEAALKNIQIADALRYYYWAQTLLRSHPDASDIKMTSSSGEEVLLITWLPVQINQIFSNMMIKIDEVEKKDNYTNCLLDIRYKNEPVHSFDYTYWGGQDWSNIVSAKDGVGVIELPRTDNGTDIRIKMEYAFEGEANIDMELRDVMQKIPQVPYKSSYMIVNTKTTKPIATLPQAISIAQTNNVSETNSIAVNSVTTTPATPTIEAEQMPKAGINSMNILNNVADKEVVMKKIITAINTKNYEAAQGLFSDDGYSIFQKLMEYGNARILKMNDLKYYQYDQLVICRSIPMSFNFKSNNRTFVENVVFYFDKDNKICNLTFSLSKLSVDDIAANTNWSEQTRMLIMSFMENYKTAYSLKRLDYIQKIFSDDALIITGTVTKVNNTPENKFLNNTIVKYNRLTKAKYLKNLEYSFKSNEYINIRFADNTVRRSGKSNDIYGIQIKQDYFSTNYGDSGYLFLLIDLSDTISPQIHVRTWQPEKNPDGSIYGLSDF